MHSLGGQLEAAEARAEKRAATAAELKVQVTELMQGLKAAEVQLQRAAVDAAEAQVCLRPPTG